MPRILLTTRCRDTGLYDYFRENAPRNFRWRFGMPRKISFGLRFLKQNLPGLTILEYPTRTEYSELLKCGWDAVGFSFYLEETNDILCMAHKARRAGVSQLWAGNYGALTPSIHAHFDRIFSSYSEHELAQLLGTTIDDIQHPPLVTEFRLPGGWSLPVGVLFSSRGCSFRCTFCISLESIDRVLRFYVQHGVHFALLLDESFGNLPSHSEEVIKLLAQHKVRWLVQSRVDLFLRNFEKWQQCGMEGALFGIESFHEEILKQMHKNEKVQAAFKVAERRNRAGLYAQGYYIIRLPSETPESVAADLQTLASLKLDVTQITIVTPHPLTEMWSDLESNYGIPQKGLVQVRHQASCLEPPSLRSRRPRILARTRLPRMLQWRLAAAHHKKVLPHASRPTRSLLLLLHRTSPCPLGRPSPSAAFSRSHTCSRAHTRPDASPRRLRLDAFGCPVLGRGFFFVSLL